MCSAVIGWLRSRPFSLRKHASAHRALTSHGWPRDCAHTRSAACGVSTCLVSRVCCASRDRTCAFVKSPRRSESAFTLKALPPVTTVFSALEWIR